MTEKCLSLDELRTIGSLPANEPRRQHLDRCPRCRARFASFRDFMEPAVAANGSKPDEADARLAAILDQEISSVSTDRQHSRQEDESEQGGLLGRLLQSLWQPALRPVWTVGIVVLAFFGIREVWDWQSDQGDRIILRQSSDTPTVVLQTEEPQVQPDGAILLSWKPVTDADSYRISFLGVDLVELQNLDAGSRTSIAVSPDNLSERGGSREPLFWQVRALRGGDEIASSDLQHLKTSP